MQPWPFSWHNGDKFPSIDDYDALRASLNAAEQAIEDRLDVKDLFRADHYFNPMKVLPDWAKNMTLLKKIGNHDFYRA